MEDSGAEFPGFQICVHKEEYVFQRPLSRLQKRAPCPLQLIKPNNKASSLECKTAAGAAKSSSSSFISFSQNKDPIPLLSPLVLPSMLESSYNIQEGNTAKSH
ncbi:hypothetical protein KPL71_012969 [Citrus sinensis]|uniref:Uncharacterized protein n=1 Tax=Citrus sinensis TaxID=2711 RepID=A0ACB8LGT3_CITSI|nr:hypothetical protein KPL71_012969 [Citrus sinensis]